MKNFNNKIYILLAIYSIELVKALPGILYVFTLYLQGFFILPSQFKFF